MGPVACGALAVGAVCAWLSRRWEPVAYVTAAWLGLWGAHLFTSVALPHYYLLWAPITVLLGAMGLVEMIDRRNHRGRLAQAVGVAAVAALAVVGVANTVATARLRVGDYGRMGQVLATKRIRPARALYVGETVERYLPGIQADAVGFVDEHRRFGLLVLDPRDTPSVGPGEVAALRARARSFGLTPHHIGRLEVWY